MRRPALAYAFPIAFALLALLVLAGCTTLSALVGNQVTFTAPQLQSYLDRRFPRDYDKLGGLVSLRVISAGQIGRAHV